MFSVHRPWLVAVNILPARIQHGCNLKLQRGPGLLRHWLHTFGTREVIMFGLIKLHECRSAGHDK